MKLENLFQNLFYILLILKTMTQLILGVKNRRHLRENYNKVPELLSDHFSLQDHQKGIRYHLAKSNLGKFQTQFEAVILLGLLPLGGINWLNDQLIAYFPDTSSNSQLHLGVAFFLILSMFSLLTGLPFKLYSIFSIEEKFGFNNMSLSQFFTDLLKQLILGAVFLIPILYGVLWLFNNLGQSWWAYAWGSITIFQFFIVWLYPRVIAPLFNKFTPLKNENLSLEISKLSQDAGFKTSSIEIMDASKRSSHGNAYFTGFGKNKKIVFFDTLIEKLTDNEVLAVLAHEMGHFAKKHIVKMMIFSLINTFLGFYLLGSLSDLSDFYSGHFLNLKNAHNALFIFMNVLPLYTFFISPLSSIFSRKHEYEADDYAAQSTSSLDLQSALIKLHKDNSAILTVDKTYAFFYYSHPPLIQRLQNLRKEAI